MFIRRLAGALSLVLPLTFALLPGALALQDPVDPGVDARALNLAAMTLDSTSIPGGFQLLAEQYLTAERLVTEVGGGVSLESLTGTGFVGAYQSSYVDLNGETQIRSYVYAYGDEGGAQEGFNLLEDEAVLASAAGLTDQAGPGAGQDPKEITTGTLPGDDTTGAMASQIADATFRVDNFIAGVAIQSTGDPGPDLQQLEGLATQLADRVAAVAGGTPPPSVDVALQAALLPLATAGESINEGYLTPDEARGLFGAPQPVLANLEGTYVQTIVLEGGGDSASAVFVTAALSEFASPEDAMAELDEADLLQPPFPGLETVAGVIVPGADGAIAYRFATVIDPTDAINSFRVIFVIGDQFATIDVQAASSAEAAETAALDLAAQQSTCLTAGGTCAAVTLPTNIAPVAPITGTPVA
ncbi:MAG: hypothetical protein M3R06_00930 [Chloroflexota bacterium]|nr:hypothetical protein [Chloroflexota bacterium]